MRDILNNIQTFIYGLNPRYVGIAAAVFMIITVILLAIFVQNFLLSKWFRENSQRVVEISREKMISGLKSSKVRIFNYDEIEHYIRASGLLFMTNEKITPLSYVLLKIGFALFIMWVGLQLNLIIGLVLLPIGYFGLDFIINESDKADNAKMLSDIEDVYDTLRIQTKAGVYITSVLTDCYLVVKNKRLKSAFLKLTSDIAAKNDMHSALDDFSSRFRNEYIDTLVVIIKQSMQTGQAAKMFDDIREQISDIDAAMLMNEKNSINAKIITVQLIIYAAIIAISVFVVIMTLMSGLFI